LKEKRGAEEELKKKREGKGKKRRKRFKKVH